MSTLKEEALKMHRDNLGKLEVKSKVRLIDAHDLSLAYSPGVAEPCIEINKDKSKIYDYTFKGNTVAVISDGTAVLGLGNIGPDAAVPVMEGKAVLFKNFAGVDAFPICLRTTDIEKIVETIKLLEPCFGGINLEDIAAPNCFIIEDRLKKETDIPIFHDDQHGTAIVTLAGLLNALKIVNKELSNIKVVINGAGASGTAITKLLLNVGVKDVIMCDSKGIIHESRQIGMNPFKYDMAKITNKNKITGQLLDALKNADVFIGVSVAGALTKDMIKEMNDNSIIFALANPTPEIFPVDAKDAGAKIIATGRSDFPNQVNNVLAFPGIFRGALDTRATDINEDMKIAAAYAIAGLIADRELNENYIIPDPFDPRVASKVASEVARIAMLSGVARINIDPQDVEKRTIKMAVIK